VAVCRELTKRFEEIARGPAAELAARLDEPVRGELTLVIGPAATAGEARGDAEAEARAAVADLVAAGTPRRVAPDVVARLTGVRRNALYRDSL
jgi:16S rRNA (cytidine1402-2'-O)-methyltransferase